MLKFFRRGGKSVFAENRPSRQPIFALDALEQRLFLHAGFDAYINFQNTKAPVPTGYRADFGHVYGNRGNGLTYGWDIDNTANARWRRNSASPDVRYDTLNHNNYNGVFTWELAVPNDTYSVRIVAGDPQQYNTTMRLLAENVMVVDGKTSVSSRWLDSTALVQVTDGRLTISNGPNANNRICFVEVTAVHVHGPPATPANFSATAEAHDRVKLSWSDVDNEEEYRIERSLNGSDWAEVVTVGSNVTTWNDTTVSELTSYQYRIIAGNFAGESAASAVASADTPAAPTKPAAPQNLSAADQSPTRIDLQWDDVAGETSYRIERSLNGTQWTTAGTTQADDTDFSDTNLNPNTTYHYRVIAINEAGDSTPSNIASDATPQVSAPATPANVVATAVSWTQIDVTWNDVAGETSYLIERSTNGTDWSSAGTRSAGATSFSDTGRSAGTTYYYRVTAINDGGSSDPSATASATTPSTPPAVVTLNGIDVGSVIAPGSTTVITPGSAYDIVSGGRDIWSSGDGMHFAHQNMTGDFDLVVRLESFFNSASWAKAGLMVRETLNKNSINAAILARPVTGDYRFQWRSTAGGTSNASGGGAASYPNTWVRLRRVGSTITGFRSNNGSTWNQVGAQTLNLSSSVFVGLAASCGSTTTATTVKFRDLSGFTPTVPTVPAAPTNMFASPLSDRIRITWSDNADNETGYVVQRSTDGVNFSPLLPGTLGPNATSFDDTTITAGVVYTYRVVAVNDVGTSAPSNSMSAQVGVPQSGTITWQQVSSNPMHRSEAVGGVVNGKLYVLGGLYNGTLGIMATPRCDVYDPSANKWTHIADMPGIPLTHSATVIDGDNIWLVGGYEGNHPGPGTARVLRYNTTSNTWFEAANLYLPIARGAGGAAIVGRELHFFGGMDVTRTLDTDDHFVLDLDNLSAGWRTEPKMLYGRNHIATVAINGKIYVLGGQLHQEAEQIAQSALHQYDPATDTWKVLSSMPAPRSHITASTFVWNGKIIILGGEDGFNTNKKTVFSYDPATDSWSSLTDLPSNRSTAVTGVLGPTKIIYSTGNNPSPDRTTWIGTLS